MVAKILPVCCSETQLKEEGSKEDEATFVYGFKSSMKVFLKRTIGLTADTEEGPRLRVFQEPIKVLLRPLLNMSQKGLF